MVELDAKGRSLNNTLPYKVAILIARDIGKPEDPVEGRWKMHPVQVLKTAFLYTTLQIIGKDIPAAAVPASHPVSKYGGFEMVEDSSVPETELHFVGYDDSLLAKVLNLSADPNRGVKDDELDDQIEHHFKYHPPTPEQTSVYNEIREAGKAFAKVIARLTPICADQASALRHVENAVMEANAAIARDGR